LKCATESSNHLDITLLEHAFYASSAPPCFISSFELFLNYIIWNLNEVEEYFSADRLLEVDIDSIVQIIAESNGLQFTARLIGIDKNKSVITSIPTPETLPDSFDIEQLFHTGAAFEMQTIHDGRIIGFECQMITLFNEQLLIFSFPEMIETRRLRKEIRFPCVLSCDIQCESNGTYGAITNISIGGCLLNVHEDNDLWIIEKAMEACSPLDLDVFLPISENPVIISGCVKSMSLQPDGLCQVGMAFNEEYDCIHRYLESLHLDSVTPFFH
jgi:c-di-GMP-binding flagellar brake protein YcgR